MIFKVAFCCITVVLAFVIQKTTCQVIRNPFTAAIANEIAATSLAAETAALANGLAYTSYGPIAGNLPIAPCETIVGPGVTGLTYGLSLADLAASNGGGLRVNSASPMASTGVTVETDSMVIEGDLAVTGQLPFLGVVALDGPLPAAGKGAVAYECGNGNVGIVSEGIEQVAPVYPSSQLAPTYPNAPVPQAFPNAPIPSGYPNAQIAQAYQNAALAPGFNPNAGLTQFTNSLAAGVGAFGPKGPMP